MNQPAIGDRITPTDCDGSVTVPDAGFGGQDMTYQCDHPSHLLRHWTDGGDLVPGYAASADGLADARDQRKADMRGSCDAGRTHALQAKAIGNDWMRKADQS